MSAEVPNQTNINKGSSFRARRLMDKWPLLVWLAILGLVIFLYTQRGVQVRLNGMIAAHTEEISAPRMASSLSYLLRRARKLPKGRS